LVSPDYAALDAAMGSSLVADKENHDTRVGTTRISKALASCFDVPTESSFDSVDVLEESNPWSLPIYTIITST